MDFTIFNYFTRAKKEKWYNQLRRANVKIMNIMNSEALKKRAVAISQWINDDNLTKILILEGE